MSDETDWTAKVQSFLDDDRCSGHQAYYAPGELTEAGVVVMAIRVPGEFYEGLASGRMRLNLEAHLDPDAG